MKFPIYRPRGPGAPDVKDDLFKVYATQTKPMETGIGSRRNNSIAYGANTDSGLERILNGDRNGSTDNRL
tara:strand:+ start:633 stop:842 length:210 start_codon:yes stop_codon:yes gene_type:complete